MTLVHTHALLSIEKILPSELFSSYNLKVTNIKTKSAAFFFSLPPLCYFITEKIKEKTRIQKIHTDAQCGEEAQTETIRLFFIDIGLPQSIKV